MKSEKTPLLLILIECFLLTSLRIDIAYGFCENTHASFHLRPRAAVNRARDGGFRELSSGPPSFSETLQSSGIFGPEESPVPIEVEKWNQEVGAPGTFPYIRGNFKEGYRKRPFLYRKYSGGKTPRDTNRLFRRQLKQVGPNLSVAYDLPSQKGMDSDHPLGVNETGLAGVSVEGLWDYETLWRGINLGEVTTSHTINQPAFMMFLMYLLVAERQGVDLKKLKATFQNDTLKEYLARKTHRLPLGITLRLWVEMQESIAKGGLTGINGTSISSYHIREAGATATQEVAFMLANALEYLSAAKARGLSVNQIAPTISFFVNLKPDLFEEVAKMRVFRSVWAKLIQELQREEIEEKIAQELHDGKITESAVEGRREELTRALPPKAQFFPVMAYTGGTDTTAQKPQNNIARVALKVLSGPLGMVQAVNTIAWDEPFTINTEHPEAIAVDTMHMLLHEKGMAPVVDLLGGSYALEAKTREMEEAVWKEMGRIAQLPRYQDALAYMGGESPYSGEIADSSRREMSEIASGARKKVGVNVATEGSELFGRPEESRFDTQRVVATQKRRLHEAKRKRDAARVAGALEGLEKAARDPEAKLFPHVKEALSAYASIGEIMDVFIRVFGESDRSTPWEPSGPVETFHSSLREFLAAQAGAFHAGVNTEEARRRGYYTASDLPYAKGGEEEQPAHYPYTRGANKSFPVYAPQDPEGIANDFFTHELLSSDGTVANGTRRAKVFLKERGASVGQDALVGNGYAIREEGATAVQELAFTLYHLEQLLKIAHEMGLSHDAVSRSISLFLSSHDNFGEEIAKFRAARRVWARRHALPLRIHAKTSLETYTTSKFWNNNSRGAWEALQAYLGGAQTIQVVPFDAPFGEPTTLSAMARQMAQDTVGLLQYESGIGEILDLAGGSFAIESWTKEIEAAVIQEIEKLEAMGTDGAFAYMRRALSENRDARVEAMKEGKAVRVGVNRFQEGPDPRPSFLADVAPVPKETVPSTVEALASQEPAKRASAASAWYAQGEPLANGSRWAIGAANRYDPVSRLVLGPYTVGVAVTPEHFDAIRAVWGNPPLSWVPEDVGVEEFEISAGGVHLDILRQKEDHPDRTIEEHIGKRGEGIQQIEFLTRDVKKALAEIKKRGTGSRGKREKIRILLAKPGLDGHDRGLKYLATILSRAGMEVSYLGLFNTAEGIVRAAIDEDVDMVAISLLSGAHMVYFPEIARLLKKEGVDIPIIGGGIIPEGDRRRLQSEYGIGPLFGPGATPEQIIGEIKRLHEWLKRPDKVKILGSQTAPREGANHTQVKFFLVRLPDGRSVLTELVEEPKERAHAGDGGAKSGDFLLSGRANISGDVIHYPEQMLEGGESEAAQVGEAFRDFVTHEVIPYSEKLDRGEVKVEESILGKAAELGMLGITVPETYGGSGAKKIIKILADLWAWYADASFASLIRVHGGVGTMPIVMFGTEEQKQKYLPKLASGESIGAYLLTDEAHGSDSLSRDTMLQTRAVLKRDPDGTEYWEMTGNKRFVTNARFSKVFTVFAMTQNGTGEWVKSAFLVERDAPGVTVEPDYHKMGLKGSSTADVKFDNVRVPKENLLGKIGQGTEIGMSILNHGRTAVASGSFGGSLRLFEETLKFVTTRPQFGKMLSEFGAVRETLADMVVSLYAQESALFAVAGLFDGGEENPSLEAAAAKVFGSEEVNRIAYQATQKHGGNGIMDEYAASRFYRDARVMTVFEGTNEILLSQVIAPLTLRYLKSEIWPQGRSLLSEWKTPEEGPLSSEIEIVRKAASLVAQTAKALEERFATSEAKKAPESQSYFMAFGKIVTELFAMTSTVSRTMRRLEKGYASGQEIKMTRVFVMEAMERVQKEASLILEPGTFQRATLPTHTLIALKHEIARETLEAGKYAPGIRPEKSSDGGTRTTGEDYSGIVTAFGGDTSQADAEIEERLAAMQKVHPAATREEAMARLAWEYEPRPREHVFPGDNFSFMYRAATSGAEILLLDLEDAVATTRKEIARDVIMLLIRAFRGEVLNADQMDFLWKNALINPKDKEAGVDAYFNRQEDGRSQLKKEYWFPENQMILVRPNNLRTKWTAGDYGIVIRGIGHLIDGIYMPKVEGAEDVRIVVGLLRAIQKEKGWVEGRHKVFVLTELPGAVLNAKEILSVAPEVEEAQLGVVDYTAATGGKNAVQLDHFTYMRYPMLHLVASARETGKVAGTGITVRLTVEDTASDTQKVVKLGIHRKWSVHPNHLKGMEPYLGEFPPVVRKRLAYSEIPSFDLQKLDRLAAASKPILPPNVFIPRETELVRSVVTIQGDRISLLTDAIQSGADMVIADLSEGAISFFESHPTEKTVAFQGDLKNPEIRVLFGRLVKAFPHKAPAVIIPAETAKDVYEADGLLTELEREQGIEIGTVRLGARLTNPEAVEKEAYPIASASRRLQWVFFDLPDLPKEAPDDPTTKGYDYYRSAFIAATSLADVDAIDGISRASDLESETVLAANWGFHGKMGAIHQLQEINGMMNPQRAGEAPQKPGKEAGDEEKRAWAQFIERWKNSVERDLEILKVYADADQDRKLGAVGFTDPYTGQPEIVDAASARIPYKQMERALLAGILSDREREDYFRARERLLLALRPGGTEGDARILPGQKILGHAVTVRPWMVQGFAKTSLDRNRYHLDRDYAEVSRFKGLVAHGLLTLSTVLSSFEQALSGYRLSSIEKFGFSAPVRYDDTIVPVIEGLEAEEGKTAVRLRAVNQEGKTVFEMFATIRPRAPDEPYVPLVPNPEDLSWLTQWVQDVTPSFPSQIFDFTDPQSPRTQVAQKEITHDLVRATSILFGKVSPELRSQLLAVGMMAMASAESVPGHLLLGGKNLTFGALIEEGDSLRAEATVPAADKIRRSSANNMPIVPVEIVVTNQKGETVFKGQVMKLMEPIAAQDGGKRELTPARPERIPSTLSQFLDLALLSQPSQTVTFPKKKIYYWEISEQSNRFANALLTLGLQKGDRVATMLPNSAEYLIAAFGSWKAGAILTTLKTQYRSEEIREQLQDTEAKVFVVFEDYLPYVEEVYSKLRPQLSILVVTREDLGFLPSGRSVGMPTLRMREVLQSASLEAPSVQILPTDLAAISYTSGSTGNPRGVTLSHQNILAATEQAAAWIREAGGGPVASLVPFTPTYGGNVVLAALKEGRSFVTFPRAEEESDFYQTVVEVFETEKVEILFAVPSSFLKLAETLEREHKILPSLRVALSRGSKLSSEIQSALEKANPGINVVEGGGLTESSAYVTNPAWAKKVGTVGKANPGVAMKIVDPTTLRELPRGSVGEVLVRGDQGMVGYWKDPEETEKVLLPDGWMRSGDLAFMDGEGYLTITGRIKEIIITGGLNVSPSEVEEPLERHPKIRTAVAAGISNPEWFGSDSEGRDLVRHLGEVVVAFVVLREGMTATSQEIIDWLKPRIAAYKIPKRVVFVKEIPRIGSYDKVDRQKLVQAYAAKDGGERDGVSMKKDREGWAEISVDRPGSFPTNALSTETFLALDRALDEANQDDAVKSIILTGDRLNFIGGGDLQYVLENIDSEAALRDYFELAHRVVLKIARGKPVVSAIDGAAVGGGAQLAFASRYRIGMQSSYFRAPEVRRLDIIQGFGGTQIIPRSLGIRKALELMLTGKRENSEGFDHLTDMFAWKTAELLASLFARGGSGWGEPDTTAFRRMKRGMPDTVSEAKLNEWESVFNEDGTLRNTPRNRGLLEILEQLRQEGHEAAALRTIKAVWLGFTKPLEEGLRIETELALEQLKTPEARRSLAKRIEESKVPPWIRLYPRGVPAHLSYPDVTLHAFIDEALEKHGDQKIHLLSGRKGDPEGRTVRYRDLGDAIDRMAHAFYDMGVRKGDRVAVMLPDSFQYMVAFFAALKIGAIATTVDTFNTPPELQKLLSISKPKVIVMLDEFYPRLTEIRTELPFLETVVLTGRDDFVRPGEGRAAEVEGVRNFTALLEDSSPAVPHVSVSPEDTAVLAFTGGVTGSPKATELTHRNLVATALQRAAWLFRGEDPTQEIILADLPYYHTYGLGAGLLMSLCQGVEMVVFPHYPGEHADAMVEALVRHNVTYLIGLPTTFDRVVERLSQDPELKIHLKGGLSSGARLEEETRTAFETMTGAWLQQGLGLTEASSIIHEPIGVLPIEESVGIPLPDVEVMIAAPGVERLIPALFPKREGGELVVRGPQVFKGYWKNPRETSRVKTEDGWFRTGDLVRMDENGRIFLLSREKTMIKVSGNQVFPREVEKVLLQHPKVAQVAVVGIPDRDTGERVVAYVCPREGRSVTEKEIEDFSRARLSFFKVPTIIRIQSGRLPKVSYADEINYRELQERAFRRHLVDSVVEGKWVWVLKQIEEVPYPEQGGGRILCEFCVRELKEAYDIHAQEEKRLSIRLFLWSLTQRESLIGADLKKEIERQIAYWLFRDHPGVFFREPIPSLARTLERLQRRAKRDKWSGERLFELSWALIRKGYTSPSPPNIFRISRERARPKAADITRSFLFKDVIELRDPNNPYNVVENKRYIPSLEEIQQASFEWGLSPEEAVAFLRARHDSHYDDPSVYAAIATFVDPHHPERQTPVMVVGLQKGSNNAENMARNGGYTTPWGYWKYIRAVRLAERYRLPVISFVDITGGWNGLSGAVEDISGAVSYAIQVGAEKSVPGISIVTGEGGSAGGLAGTMDPAYMLSNATRFVATPRGQFEILNLSKKVALLVLGESRPAWGVLYSLNAEQQGEVVKAVQEQLAKVREAVTAETLFILLRGEASKTGGKAPAEEEVSSLAVKMKESWAKFDEDFITQIIMATQADPESGRALGAIAGVIDEPLGGAHRFPKGTCFAIGQRIASFLEETQNLSTAEVREARYRHFREMGSVAGRDYVVKDHPLERKRASEDDKKRGKRGIEDWLEVLVDHKENEEPSVRELHPNLADRDEGPIDFYRRFNRPSIFPFDTYARSLEKAREATGSWLGVFTGYVEVGGKEIMLMVKDPRFAGASDKSGAVGEKVTLAIEDVIARHDREGVQIPIVFINTASGARQQDGPRSVDPLNKNNAALSLAKARGIPFINIDTVYMYGGDSASTSSYQDAAMLLATKGTQKGFTGPRATSSVEGRNLPDLYFTVEFLMKRGFLDGVVEPDRIRDLLVLYLDPATTDAGARQMEPLLWRISEQRKKRVEGVRERERSGFEALAKHAMWHVRRLGLLQMMQDQYALEGRKPWFAEQVDSKTPILIRARRYSPGDVTFPHDHSVNAPPFLTQSHAVLAALYLQQEQIEEAIAHISDAHLLGVGRENVSPLLAGAYERYKRAAVLSSRSHVFGDILAAIQWKERSFAKDGGSREAAQAFANLFKENPGALLLASGSPYSAEVLARQEAVLAIDSSLFENELTREEFEIVLSMLQEKGRRAPIWLVDTEPGSLGSPDALNRWEEKFSFVRRMALPEYDREATRLEKERRPLLRIGFNDHEKALDLLDVSVRRPGGEEAVSAFSFLSLTLTKIPVPLVITPTVEYLRAVETVYRQL